MDNVPIDDRDYVVDLGLAIRTKGGGLAIANPIYKEIIPRVLASAAQDSLPQISPTWLNLDGSLNQDNLIDAFLTFWRRHGQPLLKSAPYHNFGSQPFLIFQPQQRTQELLILTRNGLSVCLAVTRKILGNLGNYSYQ